MRVRGGSHVAGSPQHGAGVGPESTGRDMRGERRAGGMSGRMSGVSERERYIYIILYYIILYMRWRESDEGWDGISRETERGAV